MNIALIGYGKMGREIERIALERGHVITSIVDFDRPETIGSESFMKADVAIEFTRPESAYDNYIKCFECGMPLVSGTTGWLDKIETIKDYCSKGSTFFYASNFSLGVNLFFELNKRLATMMNKFPEYDAKMKEIHHTQKMDSPSGTAISLAEDLINCVDRKNGWTNNATLIDVNKVDILSERTGQVPGYHEVVWDSEVDTITIIHNAKSRVGFALGAVLAAEFTKGKKGFLGMSDMLGF